MSVPGPQRRPQRGEKFTQAVAALAIGAGVLNCVVGTLLAVVSLGFADGPNLTGLFGFGLMAMCAGAVAWGGGKLEASAAESKARVVAAARLVAASAALTLIPATIGAWRILGDIPPSDRFPFGTGMLCLLGVPWLLTVATLLAALPFLGGRGRTDEPPPAGVPMAGPGAAFSDGASRVSFAARLRSGMNKQVVIALAGTVVAMLLVIAVPPCQPDTRYQLAAELGTQDPSLAELRTWMEWGPPYAGFLQLRPIWALNAANPAHLLLGEADPDVPLGGPASITGPILLAELLSLLLLGGLLALALHRREQRRKATA